jgi:molybdopterin molybdotransferase
MEIRTKVDGVAMSPGRSFVFGLLKGTPVFSLPGSPTASIVAFEELVRPSLLKMKGNSPDRGFARPTIKMSLGGTVRGKRDLRKYILSRVVLKDGELTAVPIKKERRGAVRPMIQANGIVVLPKGHSEAHVGQQVTVRLVDLNL